MKTPVKLAAGLALSAGAALAIRARMRRNRPRYSFRDRSVLITGGSRGLGLEVARLMAAEGARLAILARDPDELERAERELEAWGAEVDAYVCDLEDPDQATNAVERVVEAYGRLDVLINDAGIIQVGPLEHMTISDFEQAMAVHAWAPLYTMLAAVPHMRKVGGGRIVNITSVGGHVAVPHLLPYVMSKFAEVGLSDGMRAELAKDGIQVTTVSPGLMRTGSHVNALFKGKHQREFAWFSILDALPFTSTSVGQAAWQIVEACRKGAPALVITPQAKLLIMMNATFPGLVAAGIKLFNRLLPGPAGSQGDEIRPGKESRSRLAPSPLTALADRAAAENNQAPGRWALTAEKAVK